MEKLCFKDFKIDWNEDFEFEGSNVNYYIEIVNDNPINLVDKYRENLGFDDGAGDNNDVYYNFYLDFDLVNKVGKVSVVVNHSLCDDYAEYTFDVELTNEEIIGILSKSLLMTVE